MTSREAYNWLISHHTETAYLASTEALLAWDQRTQIPRAGHAHRAKQLAALAKLLHQRATNPRIGECLAQVEGTPLDTDPYSVEVANSREWRRAYERATRIPERLAVGLAEAAAEGEPAWAEARPRGDWKAFKPYLARLLSLRKEYAQMQEFEGEAYDALLEDYEPQQTTALLEPIFSELRAALVDLLRRIKEAPGKPRVELLRGDFPKVRQEAMIREVIARLGYDFEGGRLDSTAHPFEISIGPGDVRITTRYDESFFNPAFFGTIHESGHAMYEQGLPAKYWGTPAGESASLGIHESQSRMWENMVARSLGFWQYFYPRAYEFFPAFADSDPSAFVFAVNAVKPSLIRVEADEVTYNLHIMVRFELELALFRGELSLDDLPAAWDEKYRDYLGVSADGVANGVMQDIHWAGGAFGYFPTYSLGNLYAAQLYKAAELELGALEPQFASGDFAPLLGWLRRNIHAQGRRYQPGELVRVVTGEELNPAYLIGYLRRKYSQLYSL